MSPPMIPRTAADRPAASAPATVAEPQSGAPSNSTALGEAAKASRRRPGRVGRIAHALSGLLSLAAISGVAVAAFDMDAAVQGLRWTASQIASLAPASAPSESASADASSVAAPAMPVTEAAPAPALESPAAPPAAEAPSPTTMANASPAPAGADAPVLPGAETEAKSETDPTSGPMPPTSEPPVGQTVAKPGIMAAEARHFAHVDDLIAPVRDAPFSVEDATHLRDAFAPGTSAAQTLALRASVKDPVARKMIDWLLARGGNGSAREIQAFAAANPDWPNQDRLRARAEEQLFVGGGSAREIKAFFDAGAPRTGLGMAALASAFLAEGDDVKARTLAASAWRRDDIPTSLEAGFLDRFRRQLGEADHKARLDTYLIDNTRWMPDRVERANVARRVLPLLGDAERKKAEARVAAYLRQPTADALLTALPADAVTTPKPDWGLAFQLAQWHRRAGRLDAAVKLLRDAPTDAATAGNLDEWWEEKRATAYDLLKAAKPQVAYDLVREVGVLSVNQAKDQQFLAGYIALRQLKDPAAAITHFKAFEAVADGPLSRSKAGYWLARAYEANGSLSAMTAPLERAAKNIDTFYGQLARLELHPDRTDIRIAAPREPTAHEAKHFNSSEVVRAAVLSRKANLDRWVSRSLLGKLGQTLDNEAEQGMLAHLAEALGDTQQAIHIAKAAVANGNNLLLYSYPIHGMPTYSALRPPIEPALTLAITRQETEFDDQIVSGAGAKGLMQVMKVTAEQVCHDYHFKCELDRLSTDRSYNVMMASAYIADRLDEFHGSYVLTIPGYNAGPGRVRQWLREFGDPRTGQTDPVDWIHRVPFEETREYIQKVLSNTQMYRARLGDEAHALRLTEDLHRTAPAKHADAVRP